MNNPLSHNLLDFLNCAIIIYEVVNTSKTKLSAVKYFMNFKNKGTSALPTASLNKSFRAIFVLILSMFTFSFFSCDGGLFDSSDGIVIKAYDADSWQDTGIPYANRAQMQKSLQMKPSIFYRA